jgi:phosphatidylinositol-3-phosphatase
MPQVRPWRAAFITAASALLVAGCSAGGTGESSAGAASSTITPSPPDSAPVRAPASAGTAAGPLPVPDHLVVVVFENKDADQVNGSPAAPYLNSLAAQGASLTDAHGETHPSQPNYLALFSGSTRGVTDDSCPESFTADNLAAQLRAGGKTFIGYSESLPQAGYTGCTSGDYARKHNPWADFPKLPATVNQPMSAMPGDYAKLPTVSFVVPNLCNDMHNCPVATGDRWAREHLAAYVQWATAHNSLLIVTFDEDGGAAGNHIPTIVAGAGVRPGPNGQRVDHYSLLRTIEDMYRLPRLGHAATAQSLTGIWTGTTPAVPTT